MREVRLPSGALLIVNSAPFADSKALYQALLSETKNVSFSAKSDMGEMLKNFFCAGFSSPLVDRALSRCMERCTVEGSKIDGDTFEAVERRQDYTIVCAEVAKENVGPFLKSLFADFKKGMSILGGILEPTSKETTTS